MPADQHNLPMLILITSITSLIHRHEGETRVLDARTIQNACEWAVQQLQKAIDAMFAYLHRRLSGAAAVAKHVLVEGLAGGLWKMVAWVERSIRATIEWTARGIVAGVIWVWTLFTTSVRFALDVALTIARACVDVVIATLREMGQFLKWLTARIARITAEVISSGFEVVVGGMVALGMWIREGIVAVRLAIYSLVLDVLQSIKAFFVDVGRSIWEFVVDTATAVQQVYLDAVAGIKAAAQSAMYVGWKDALPSFVLTVDFHVRMRARQRLVHRRDPRGLAHRPHSRLAVRGGGGSLPAMDPCFCVCLPVLFCNVEGASERAGAAAAAGGEGAPMARTLAAAGAPSAASGP